jgi:hypothetical protein
MPKYEVRLGSPVDSQARIISLDAENEAAARESCEQSELDIVNFSLLPPDRDAWEQGTYLQSDEDGGVTVNLANWDAHDKEWAEHAASLSYKDAVRAAERRLTELSGRVDVADSGKVRRSDLKGRALARVLAHNQAEPYGVVDVRTVDQAEIDRLQVVRAAQRLLANPGDWERTLDALREAGVPMNAVTAFLYGVPWQKQIDGSSVTVFSSATVKMSLHTGLTAVQDTDDFFNDVSGTEITGTGYTAGGYLFAAKTTAYDTATDQIRLDNTTDPSWTTSTLSATDAIVWVDTAGASTTDPVYANVDFGATVTTTAGTFQITLDATGWSVFDIT